MNQIPIYQHPFVDVFKATKVTEWGQYSQKEGDVTEVYDKQLAKNVIKVSGVTPASNYFQIPAQAHLPKKPLGLIGKYVYATIMVPAGKTFVLHFDYIISDTRLVRVSISNIFKEFKNLNGNSLQIPVFDGVPFNKWTVLCLNAHQILESNQVFPPGQKESFFMRSLQATSNVQIRGIYTSDIHYTVQTLPKDMALKILKGQDWFSQYSWFEYPQQEGAEPNTASEAAKENAQSNNGSKKPSIKGVSRPGTAKKASGPGKSVKFTNNEDLGSLESSAQQVSEPPVFNQQEEVKEQDVINRENVERTLKEIEEIKSQYMINLEEKHLQPRAEVTFYYDQDVSMYPKPQAKVQRTLVEEDFFVLKPNPIMKLDRTIGMHPRFHSGKVFFNKDAKLSREILYTQANLLLGYQHSTQKQRLFYEKPTTAIENFYVDGNYAFTVTRSSDAPQPYLQAESGNKDFEITIWDVQDAQQVFSFKPPLSLLHSISLNQSESKADHYMCVSGRDFQKRDAIIIYNFDELISQKRVEIYARQLCDFDLVNIRFNDASPSSLVACGRENIRFFKIKNGHLPGQLVTLNNTARGKTFCQSLVDFTIGEKGTRKATTVYVTTQDGLLYFVNYGTRQIDKIIQIHEDKITSLLMGPNRNFIVTASINGILRLWSPDFSKLISEVNTQQGILDCDVNHKEIVVLGAAGTLSLLDMEESTFNVIMRSHLDNVQDLCFNKPSSKIVTVGLDQKIYIWNSESMEVVTEFTTNNDVALKLTTSQSDSAMAIGFKSGFIRIFDLSFENSGKLMAETMIFEAPVMDLQYSPDNKFLAVFYKTCRIVIFSIEKGYQPVKSIDYEFPNENYFSLSFSPDSKYLANISSNANNVTVWETKNFSLKFHVDLTGDIVSRIKFAPNGKDLVMLTTSSKLKFYRISFSELKFNKEIYGVTDLECLDFEISPNCKFIAVCGKEGVVKVYDYFMRGAATPSSQAFIGHFKHPKRVFWHDDMRFLYTLGDGNGIFRWSFFGDKELPSDLSRHYEEIEPKKETKKVEEPIFNHEELLKMTQQQIDQGYDQLAGLQNLPERAVDPMQSLVATQAQPKALRPAAQIQYNHFGYRFEQQEIELKKVLQCSIGSGVRNNLVWHKEYRYIAYTSANIIIVEQLNQEKTQTILREGNDKIFQLKLSPNGRLLLAFTRHGEVDGFPCILLFDSATHQKLNHISIPDHELVACEFSKNSNMLLVLSKSPSTSSEDPAGYISQVALWDFLDGHKDIMCKSHLPLNLLDMRWNFYLGDSLEFVTVAERQYHYWKITPNLTLQYQEGEIPKKRDLFASRDDKLTTCEFAVPMPDQITVFLVLGLNNGYVWVSDSRCNQFLYNMNVIDSPIRQIFTTRSKIVIEGTNDAVLHCWPQGQGSHDPSDPNAFFLDKKVTLTLDGYPQATSYDEVVSEGAISTSSGTIWFVSWVDCATIKIKSCHSPLHQITCVDFKYIPPSQFQPDQNVHEFDQNYLIASAGKDGVIKLWTMYDSEFFLQFIVPKEECVAIAMHQFKPYMVASFTDGFLRFFEIENKSKTLGRCQIQAPTEEQGLVDYLISIKILPSGNHILGASRNGQVILIYIQQWDPLAIKLEQLASINTTINTFDLSYLEPYNKWLVGTANGKAIVYNRKDFNAYQQELFNEENPPKFNYMDSFNLLDYVDNSFTESKRSNTLDHYYSTSKRNLVSNSVDPANCVTGMFSNQDLTLHLSYLAKSPYIFIRNFELHQVCKRLSLTSLPLQLSQTPNTPFFVVLQADNQLVTVDAVNDENRSARETTHEEAKAMKICPNGRYVLTGGSRGDVAIWSLKKREVSPEEVAQLIQQ